MYLPTSKKPPQENCFITCFNDALRIAALLKTLSSTVAPWCDSRSTLHQPFLQHYPPFPSPNSTSPKIPLDSTEHWLEVAYRTRVWRHSASCKCSAALGGSHNKTPCDSVSYHLHFGRIYWRMSGTCRRGQPALSRQAAVRSTRNGCPPDRRSSPSSVATLSSYPPLSRWTPQAS